MKAYLAVTGSIGGLIGVLHLVRLFVEGHPLSDAWFVGTNVALFLGGGGLAAWAAWLFASSRRHGM